jgi:hypothetical protein
MNRRQTILKVFTRKYQLSLTSEAIQFLEEILDEHEVQDEDVQHSVEVIAKEYSVQDGKSASRTIISSSDNMEKTAPLSLQELF